MGVHVCAYARRNTAPVKFVGTVLLQGFQRGGQPGLTEHVPRGVRLSIPEKGFRESLETLKTARFPVSGIRVDHAPPVEGGRNRNAVHGKFQGGRQQILPGQGAVHVIPAVREGAAPSGNHTGNRIGRKPSA